MSAATIFAAASVVIGVAQIEISVQASAAASSTERRRLEVAERACSLLIVCCGLGVIWSAP